MLHHSSNPIPAPAADGDPLTAMLRGLRLDGVQYARCRLVGDWCFAFPEQANAGFHFVAERGCWLRVAGGGWIELCAGDAVLMPRGVGHLLASAPGLEPKPFPRQDCRPICDGVLDYDGGQAERATVLFCGTMRFNLDALHPMLRMMPDLMRANELMMSEPAIPHLLDAMGAECALSRVGASGILARLADVLAGQIIRSWVERGCAEAATGWIAAVRDPLVGRVLAAVHAEPDRDWTVAELARLMGASRSSFAAKFTAVVGTTPARYVAEVRMHQARQWILRDRVRIAEAANRLGYDSEASFSRAFKRIVGTAPGRLRSRAA